MEPTSFSKFWSNTVISPHGVRTRHEFRIQNVVQQLESAKSSKLYIGEAVSPISASAQRRASFSRQWVVWCDRCCAHASCCQIGNQCRCCEDAEAAAFGGRSRTLPTAQIGSPPGWHAALVISLSFCGRGLILGGCQARRSLGRVFISGLQ